MRVPILLLALIGATALIGQGRLASENGFLFPGEARTGGSYLGVTLADIDADRAKMLKLEEPRGVEVVRVEAGSPAEKAGIKASDVLFTYNGEAILGAQQLGRLVRETPEGRKVRVQLWREGRSQTLTIVTERHASRDFDMDAELRRLYIPGQEETFNQLRSRLLNMTPEIPSPMLMWTIPALGIECEIVDSQLADYFGVKHGMLVRSVAKASPAEKAGLKAGDVLTSIGDRPIATSHDVTGFLRMQRQPGTPTSLGIVREHRQLTLQVAPLENHQ
ncbi:MAG: PDZ domain-containing protein [Bryobacteraceae bacterium]